MSRAHGVDVHPIYQGMRIDDKLDEGFPPLAFVIQKVADGLLNYITDLGRVGEAWRAQRKSVEDVPVKGGYHWFRTALSAIQQAIVAIEVWDSGLLDFLAVDFERWGNVLDKKAALGLRDYVEYIRKQRPEAKILLYCNWEIYLFLRQHLGAWLDTIELWFAGGIYYNMKLTQQIDDDINPKLPTSRTQWTFWQYSADRNEAADEHDFSTKETDSIDVDVFNGTPEQLCLKYGKGIMDSVKKIGKYYLLRLMPRPV